MDKAAELCPQGYDVIDAGAREGALAQSNTNAITGQTVTTVTPTFRGNMTVRCRVLAAPLYTHPPSMQPLPSGSGPVAVSAGPAPTMVIFRDKAGNVYRIKPEALMMRSAQDGRRSAGSS